MREIKIVIDGEEVPLNPFVKEIVLNTIEGLLSSLHGTEGREVEIRIIRGEE
jgi:hypothetical protein